MTLNPRLPQDEVRYLSTLYGSPKRFHERLHALHKLGGWSINALAQSLSPQRAKSTVHFWVVNATSSGHPHTQPIPIRPPNIKKVYEKKRPEPQPLPSDTATELKSLALLAKKFRSKTSETSDIYKANQRLTELALELSLQGVPTLDIAIAAGVTYRSMARRVATKKAPQDYTLSDLDE